MDFGFIFTIFNEFFYRPLFNGLIFFYWIIPGQDLGIAIISLTIFIRLILFPLNQKAIISQKALAELQPQLKEIQEKFKHNKEQQSKAVMEFYKKNNVNPLSGCFPILIQFPILIGLYRVFLSGLDESKLDTLYFFVKAPESINPYFLGIVDLSTQGSETFYGIGLILLTGLSQYIQAKTLSKSVNYISKTTISYCGRSTPPG